jgi:Domain of unknown function (DUF397)
MELTRIRWRKSTYSSTNGGECIQVGTAPRTVAVRDSKDPAGPSLTFAPGRWQAFTRAVKNDRASR